MSPFYQAVSVPDPDLTPEILARKYKIPIEEARITLDRAMNAPLFKNDTYQVAVFMADKNGDVIHLSIKRIDRQPIHDWRELQEIKNMIVDPECEAFEIYPAESRLVDAANQYHLWCYTDPKFRIPFGFKDRFTTEDPLGKSEQRPFAESRAEHFSGGIVSIEKEEQ